MSDHPGLYKLCPRCKEPAPVTHAFCEKCGRQYRSTAPVNHYPQAGPPQYQPPPPPAVVNPSDYVLPKSRNHSIGWAICASLLCLPTGQCYNGQGTKGFVITLGIVLLSLSNLGYSPELGIYQENAMITALTWCLSIASVIDAGIVAWRLRQGQMVHKWRFF